MVMHGIILRHIILNKEIEVDKAKINLIANLSPPKSIKDIRSILRHARFYQHFIKDFSKIARHLTKLLIKNVSFEVT